MKKEKISDIIGELDEKIIEEAASCKENKAKVYNIKKFSIAACLTIALAIGGIAGFNLLTPSTPDPTPSATSNITAADGIIQRNYKSTAIAENSAILWRWEYLAPDEKYLSIEVNGITFNSKSQEINSSFVGDLMGSYTAKGYDFYENNKEYSEASEVYSIKNVSEKCRVAVKFDNKYYVYGNSDGVKPTNLRELVDSLGLDKTARISGFSVNNATNDNEYRALNEDDALWQILSDCKEAPIANGDSNIQTEHSPSAQGQSTPGYNPGLPAANEFSLSGRKYISFTVTSEAIGAYKLVLSVTEDGFVWTNIADYGYAFEIGIEKAKQIIDYANANSAPAQQEPYQYSIIGTVTEITDNYVLVDDTQMCVNKNEGMVFKVLTENVKIRRCFEYEPYGINVGSTVIISFRNPISVTQGNTVLGAVDVQKGIVLQNGDMVIPE